MLNKRLFLFNIKLLKIVGFILFVIVLVALLGLSYLLNRGKISFDVSWQFFLLLAVLLFIHELLHGVAFALFGRVPFLKIKYGCNIKKVIAYCTCEVPITKNDYFIVAIFPLLVTSIIPAYFALIMARLDAVLFVALAFASSIGDIVMAMEILRLPKGSRVLDCPKDAGFYLVEGESRNKDSIFRPLFSEEFEEDDTADISITKGDEPKIKMLWVAIISFCFVMVFLSLLYIGVRSSVADFANEAGKAKFKQEYRID